MMGLTRYNRQYIIWIIGLVISSTPVRQRTSRRQDGPSPHRFEQQLPISDKQWEERCVLHVGGFAGSPWWPRWCRSGPCRRARRPDRARLAQPQAALAQPQAALAQPRAARTRLARLP